MDITVTLLIQTIISGLLLGLFYTGMSLGLSLTMGVLRVVNVAHGSIMILGAYLCMIMLQRFGLDPLLSIFVVLPIFFLLGMFLERILIRRVVQELETISLLVLFGVAVIIENSSILIWLSDTRAVTAGYTGTSWVIGPITLPVTRVIAAIVTMILVLLCNYYLKNTLYGKATRAMAQNRDASQMLGLNVEFISMTAFGIGTALTAAGGVLMALIFPFAPQDQIQWLTISFLIVIVGGLGDIRNTLIAAIFIGIIETMSVIFLPFKFGNLVLYGLLALALMIRGQGLASQRSRAL
jgi:branched-chain amino acid transport system permease protein